MPGLKPRLKWVLRLPFLIDEVVCTREGLERVIGEGKRREKGGGREETWKDDWMISLLY